MTEDSPKDKKELLITLVIVASVIIASTLLYFYWSDEPDNAFEPIDRSINFPEDEGLHNETFERWTIFGTMNTKEGDEFEILIRWLKHLTEDKVSIEYILRNKQDGEEPIFELETGGVIHGAYDKLDIVLSGGNTVTTMKSVGSFKYQFYTEIDTDIQLELTINSRKTPVLFGDEGKLYQPGFGTAFGYYQPHLELDGMITISEIGELDIEGVGWLEHMWGGDIKSLFSETWHIHLDNSMEIFITKMYEHDVHVSYPDDLFLYVVNIIRTDGKILTPELGVDIYMENQDYNVFSKRFHQTTERWEYSAWSTEWRLFNSDMDINIKTHGNSLHEGKYLGFIEVEGFYMGQRVNGQGAGEFTYRYISFPNIENVNDDFSIFRSTEPVEVRANISYNPPMEITDIYLNYSVDDGDWIRVDMEFVDEYWTAVIPPQEFGSTIEYQVIIEDIVDNVVKSQIESYYIDYV